MAEQLHFKDMVAIVATKLGRHPKDVKQVAEAFVNAVAGAVAAGRRVRIMPLGVFEVRTRAARQGRNPATGGIVQIPEKTVAKWKPGIRVKRALNQ